MSGSAQRRYGLTKVWPDAHAWDFDHAFIAGSRTCTRCGATDDGDQCREGLRLEIVRLRDIIKNGDRS